MAATRLGVGFIAVALALIAVGCTSAATQVPRPADVTPYDWWIRSTDIRECQQRGGEPVGIYDPTFTRLLGYRCQRPAR